MPGFAQPHQVPTPSPLKGQHFPPRGHWTQPCGSCPTEGVCWAAPMHPTSPGAGGQGWPCVPSPLSGALLNGGCDAGGGQGARHGLASGLWGLGNPNSWVSLGAVARLEGRVSPLAHSTPSFVGSHLHQHGCHHRSPSALQCCDMRGRETEARLRCAEWGHAAPRSPWLPGSPVGGQRGPAGASPYSGAARGAGTALAPLPSPSSLPPRAGGTQAGWGGEGKEVGLWRQDPMSPKNVPRSLPF